MTTTAPCSAEPHAAPSLTAAHTWAALCIDQADGWIGIAYSTDGTNAYYWPGGANPGAYLDCLECLNLLTQKPMPARVAVYPTPEDVTSAWLCYLDELRRCGARDPQYHVVPMELAAIGNRRSGPTRTALSDSVKGQRWTA